MQNLDKPNVATPETYLNIGNGFSLLVGGVYKLIIGALGTGGMTNASKVSIGETWGSIASTWAGEPETWEAASQLFTNTTNNSKLLYGVESISFSPVTLTDSAISLSLGDDEISSAIVLPFRFRLFDAFYTHVYISSNGNIGFTPSGMASFLIRALPSPITISRICGYLCDLDPTQGGTIKYQTIGIEGARKFIVEYSNIEGYGDPTSSVTTQIILYESDMSIEIHTTSAIPPTGTKSTQGIESIDGVSFYTYPDRNFTFFSLTNDAVRFNPQTSSITNINKP